MLAKNNLKFITKLLLYIYFQFYVLWIIKNYYLKHSLFLAFMKIKDFGLKKVKLLFLFEHISMFWIKIF